MHFAYTIVYVANVEKSLAFFERAFGFKRRFMAPGEGYGELDTGGTTLSFAHHDIARGTSSFPPASGRRASTALSEGSALR
jgi:catechol 2,3-dioxygenase-like lactoylglutathione lyase family enzyme